VKAPIAAEMYTVRDAAARDLERTLERIAMMGYLGIELAGLHGIPPKRWLGLIEELDLTVIGGVIRLPGEIEYEQSYADAREIGLDTGIVMLWEENFTTTESVKRAAEQCNEFAAEARSDGIELLYHNHWWECTPRADGTVPLLELASLLEPDVGFVVDIYWVAAGGVDVATILGELGEKARRLHLKDGCLKSGTIDVTEPMTAVGDGEVGIAAAVAAAPQADWHVTELDEYDGDPFDALERSYRYLTQQGLSVGRA
jgi:sugar phosphate isomerase/epimerase